MHRRAGGAAGRWHGSGASKSSSRHDGVVQRCNGATVGLVASFEQEAVVAEMDMDMEMGMEIKMGMKMEIAMGGGNGDKDEGLKKVEI